MNMASPSGHSRSVKLSEEHESALERLRRHQKQAFEFISAALEIDEGSRGVKNKPQAIALYKKGIEELERGLSVDVNGQSPDVERAKALQEKMINNLSMASDRLQDISDVLKEHSTSDQSSAGGQQSVTGIRSRVKIPAKEHQSANLISVNDSNNPKHLSSRRPVSLPRSSLASASRSKMRNSASNERPSKTSAAIASKSLDRRSLPSNFKNVDKSLANKILDEIIDNGPCIKFDDIAGQEISKQALQEIVIFPSLRPELFTGLRTPARGLLLFGPPGNGKTMLAKAVACESNAIFFNISAATLTSKWLGEAEKLVRALFAVAKELQPSIIFVDEIDSLFCERRENEHEASRRIKTQFMIEFQGMQSESDDRVLVMGATNRPFELDDAVLRRFPKRIHVPMPDEETRYSVIENLLKKQGSPLRRQHILEIARETEGYSASDLTALAKDAALGPIRELGLNEIKCMDAKKLRDISICDFKDSLRRIRQSVPPETLQKLENWNRQYGDIST